MADFDTIETSDLDFTELADAFVVNRGGKSYQISVTDNAKQLLATAPLAAALRGAAQGYLTTLLWNDLVALAGFRDGQSARVSDLDEGSHEDTLLGTVVPNAGEYVWNAALDGWVRLRSNMISPVVFAENSGLGTPNAIVATSLEVVREGALVALPIAFENTTSVTVAFNGGSPLNIETGNGQSVDPGGLVAGTIVLGIVSGSAFLLVGDQVSASIVAMAQAAADAAAQSAAHAQDAANSIDLPPIGAPLSAIRTNLAGTSRETYDPSATVTAASLGMPANNDFAFPLADGKLLVANRWSDGPLAVELARRDSATWVFVNASRIVSGLATNVVPSAMNGAHGVSLSSGLSLAAGDVGYASIIAKANGYKFLRVVLEGYDEIVVDLANATVVKEPSVPNSLLQYTVVALLNGWVYISIRCAAASVFSFNVSYSINDNTGTSGASSYVGDGVNGVLIHTASPRQQLTVSSYGFLKSSTRGGNSYDIEQLFINGGDGFQYRRTGQGSPVRWSAWALVFDEVSIGAPAYLLKEAMLDRNDVRDYQVGINLYSTSGNAVDKFKAAVAAYDDSRRGDGVLRIPRGRMYFGDTLFISKMNFRWEGAGRQTWDRMVGESTGSTNHPVGGTQIESAGGGNSRRWTDIDNGGAGDAARKPLVVVGMPGVKLKGFSLVTPKTGGNIWSDGLMVLGAASHCDFEDFNCYGGFSQSGIWIDNTLSKYNAAMITLLNGHGLGPALVYDLMAAGPTNNKFRKFEAAGVSAVKAKGTTRSKGAAGEYTASTWLWAPNGMSDTTFENFALYQFGDQAARLAGGACISLDHRLFTGATPNNSGQNVAFRRGRIDGAGKWAIYMENIDAVTFDNLFGETSGAWFSATGTRSIIERTAATGADRYFTKSKMFFNYTSPTESNITVANNYWDGRGVMS